MKSSYTAICILGFLALLIVIGGFFSIPLTHNDYKAVSVPSEYKYRILVQPDYPWNSEYIVRNYNTTGLLTTFHSYYQSIVDSTWPSARTWTYVEEYKEIPTNNIQYIKER